MIAWGVSVIISFDPLLHNANHIEVMHVIEH